MGAANTVGGKGLCLVAGLSQSTLESQFPCREQGLMHRSSWGLLSGELSSRWALLASQAA